MLTPENLNALAEFLLKRFRAFVRPKGEAVEMQIVANALGVGALLGAGVPTTQEFLTRWWTTVGPVIYAPAGRAEDLGGNVPVLSHELTHVVQFWRDHVMFMGRYLTPFGRAELEAEAERSRLEVCWILWGALPSLEDLDTTRHGYALDDQHADLTRDLLEQAATSVASGIISTDVGLAVLTWTRLYHPTAVMGRIAGQ